MKKLLLLFVFLQSIYAGAAHVQITFTDGFGVYIINPFFGMPSMGTATTDNAVNTIFQTHNVVMCYEASDSGQSIIFAEYTGDNLNGFVSDIQSNPNVANARICPVDFTYSDRMYMMLIDGNDGNPLDEVSPNGNIMTSNGILNQVFEDYNVKAMVKLSPNLTIYELFFDGDAVGLFDVLTYLDEITSPPEYIGVPMLLGIDSPVLDKPSVFPNPFSSVVDIKTSENIVGYSLFDMNGKQLVETDSKSVLDNKTSELQSGIYILNLESGNGTKSFHKLIKH